MFDQKMKRKVDSVKQKCIENDQVFTSPVVAQQMIELFEKKIAPLESFDLVVEPSAGRGAFFNLMPTNKRRAYEIDESLRNDEYIYGDFLEMKSLEVCREKVAIIGNPPYGKNSSKAIAFFNKSCEFADTVAFILPQTFYKESVQRRLCDDFHLVYSHDMSANAFILASNDKPYSVNSVFQIWRRMDTKRVLELKETSHPDFEFLNKNRQDRNLPETCFLIRMVGTNAGAIITDRTHVLKEWDKKNKNLYYVDPHCDGVLETMLACHFEQSPNRKHTTRTGMYCLSKGEIVEMYVKTKK